MWCTECNIIKNIKSQVLALAVVYEIISDDKEEDSVPRKRIKLQASAAVEPPATEPPAAEPPVTEPPVIEPPVAEPPVTEPTVATVINEAPAIDM